MAEHISHMIVKGSDSGKWQNISGHHLFCIKYCKYSKYIWWLWVWLWQSKGDKKFSGIGYIWITFGYIWIHLDIYCKLVNEIKLCAELFITLPKINLLNLQNCAKMSMDGKPKKRRVCFQVGRRLPLNIHKASIQSLVNVINVHNASNSPTPNPPPMFERKPSPCPSFMTYQYHLAYGCLHQNFPQTSVDQSVEASAMQTFVVFERGDSGDLTFNQFKKVSTWQWY